MSSISGLYSPLPQSISDSDSEREFHMDSLCPPNTRFNENVSDRKGYSKHGPYNKQSQDQLPNMMEAKVIKPQMSTTRKLTFIMSIILCFLPIVIFLWVLPCDADTCPVKVLNWETQQEDVEMKGKINLFFERFKKHFNLAVQYKGDSNSQEILKHGVISLLGNNGEVNWYFRQPTIPQNLDCSLIDVDSDGIRDCLLLDEKGLKAVEVVSGQTVWHVHSHEERTLVENLQFPAVLKDFNHDGVDELMSIYQQKYFMIICGRTGKALCNIIVNECNQVEELQTTGDYVGFHCVNDTVTYLQIQISEIKRKYFNSSHMLNFVKFNLSTSDTNIFRLDQYKLNIENFGTCPDCHSYLKLLSDHDKVIYTKVYNKSHIINPSKFKFGVNAFSAKKHIKGFIVKVWQWHYKFSPKYSSNDLFTSRKDVLNNTNYGNYITERIILITLNDTDYNVVEASTTNITQLCFHTESDFVSCQPDFKNQEYSILIADLDRDGSQELIYYSSSFYLRENVIGNPWQLISTIKLLKLESELPKLYNSKETFGMYPNY
ncbi:uncharacterized protein LOC123308251 [Coccinella septempunctata]|uniref:uncharacterized protein LOC123308251 n=1 Tax=Coccinella septempunctata TaxID=41139 RepID=UPI001D08FB92|nr:uncharacterized protein LOC123308251 [Coccinella septempunctata]